MVQNLLWHLLNRIPDPYILDEYQPGITLYPSVAVVGCGSNQIHWPANIVNSEAVPARDWTNSWTILGVDRSITISRFRFTGLGCTACKMAPVPRCTDPSSGAYVTVWFTALRLCCQKKYSPIISPTFTHYYRYYYHYHFIY